MLQSVITTEFKKDFKRQKKRGKPLEKIQAVMKSLVEGKALEPRYRDHVLVGNYNGRRECHIEPDWLLIYKKTKTSIIFERTGTHSDLF